MMQNCRRIYPGTKLHEVARAHCAIRQSATGSTSTCKHRQLGIQESRNGGRQRQTEGKRIPPRPLGVGRKPETRTPNPKNPTPNPKNPRPENPNVISGVISRNPKLLRVNRVSIHGNRNSRITRILRHPLAAHVCAQYFSPAQQH
jgi:hypothetical protein